MPGKIFGRMNFETVSLDELRKKGIALRPDPPKDVILVVDDEVVIADSLVAILNKSGITAMAAYDGQSALEMAQLIPPDLLLTDVVMPGMSGIDLAIAVKEAVPDCRIMLFSGQAATLDLLSVARRKGHDFTTLAKPIHPTELLAKISETLRPQLMGVGSAVHAGEMPFSFAP
jgi:DNA-binding response OmpR family regulator